MFRKDMLSRYRPSSRGFVRISPRQRTNTPDSKIKTRLIHKRGDAWLIEGLIKKTAATVRYDSASLLNRSLLYDTARKNSSISTLCTYYNAYSAKKLHERILPDLIVRCRSARADPFNKALFDKALKVITDGPFADIR